MKLVEVEFLFDGAKSVFYFTAEGRVDFRQLVKELARECRIRIEMRQIGVRDEARMIGGYGICGREFCCASFLSEFEPISIRMAKDQDLPLSPGKVSGVCGRLMCCLGYESRIYEEFKRGLPRIGERVNLRAGTGRVRKYHVFDNAFSVELESGEILRVNKADWHQQRRGAESGPPQESERRPDAGERHEPGVGRNSGRRGQGGRREQGDRRGGDRGHRPHGQRGQGGQGSQQRRSGQDSGSQGGPPAGETPPAP
jgi:hypothetical protein